MFNRKPYEPGDWLIKTIKRVGCRLPAGARVLDYGCGEGALVYRLRELGFDAYGFDIHKRVEFRSHGDEQFFGFADQNAVKAFDMTIAPENAFIPFPDRTFDTVISTSVLEHVLDHRAIFRETARVLKLDGFCFHAYPSRSSLIEPHMYVPLATRWQSRGWLLLWANLGVRSEHQTGLKASQVADANLKYCRTGICYPSRRQMMDMAHAYFNGATFVTRRGHGWLPVMWRPIEVAKAMRLSHPLKALAITQRLELLVTRYPRSSKV